MLALALWPNTRLEKHRSLGGEIGRRITVHPQDDDLRLYICIMKQVSHHRDKQLSCCFSELMMTREWTVHIMKKEYHKQLDWFSL